MIVYRVCVDDGECKLVHNGSITTGLIECDEHVFCILEKAGLLELEGCRFYLITINGRREPLGLFLLHYNEVSVFQANCRSVVTRILLGPAAGVYVVGVGYSGEFDVQGIKKLALWLIELSVCLEDVLLWDDGMIRSWKKEILYGN